MPLKSECFVCGPMENNVLLLSDSDTDHSVIVDPSLETDAVFEELRQRSCRVTGVWLTHGHCDHVFTVRQCVDAFGCPIAIGADDVDLYLAAEEQAFWLGLPSPAPPPEPDTLLHDGDSLTVGNCTAQVLATPGHSPGSVSFYFPDDGVLVCGDVLFAGSVGRTDLPGSSPEALRATLRDRILALPDDTVVWSGHGPQTTVGRERSTNPFLQEL